MQSIINPIMLAQQKQLKNIQKLEERRFSSVEKKEPIIMSESITLKVKPEEASGETPAPEASQNFEIESEPQTRPHSASTIARQERLDLLTHQLTIYEILMILLKPIMLSLFLGSLMSLIVWIMNNFIHIVDWKINDDGTTFYSENYGYLYTFYEMPQYILLLPITTLFYMTYLTDTNFWLNLVFCLGHIASIVYTSSITFSGRLGSASGIARSCYQESYDYDFILLFLVNFGLIPLLSMIILYIINKKERKQIFYIYVIIIVLNVFFKVLFTFVFSLFYQSTVNNNTMTKYIIRMGILPFSSIVGSMILKFLVSKLTIKNESLDVIVFAPFIVILSIISRYISNIQDTYLTMTIFTLIGSFSDIFIRYLFPRIKKFVLVNLMKRDEKRYIQINNNPLTISRNARIIILSIILEFTLTMIIYLAYFIKQTSPLEFANNHLIYEVERHGSEVIGKFNIAVITYGTFLSMVLEIVSDMFLIKNQKKFNIPIHNAINQIMNFRFQKTYLFWFLFTTVLFGTFVYVQTIMQSTGYFNYLDSDACLIYTTCNADICCNQTFLTSDGRNITNMFVENEYLDVFCNLINLK